MMEEITSIREYLEQTMEDAYAKLLESVYRNAYMNGESDDTDDVRNQMRQARDVTIGSLALLERIGYVDKMQAEVNAMYEES